MHGRAVAVKIQYPGIAEALEADLRNAGTLVRLARALAPGLDAKEIADEIRERVMEELDYEYEAQNQRSFARAYRDHPFIYVPEVVTRLSRRRVLVTELVEGLGFGVAVVNLVHHIHRDQWPIVFGPAMGRLGWFVESRAAPLVYRHCRYVTVSQATRASECSVRKASSTASEIRSQTLSGCPSDTDSEVNT